MKTGICRISSIVAVAMIALGGCSEPGELELELSFEGGVSELGQSGWAGGPLATLGIDRQIRHRGDAAGRVIRTLGSPGEFSSLTNTVGADIAGETITYRAWVRSRDVDQYFGIWLRQDGRGGPVDFTHNYDLKLSGDQDWQQVSITTNLVEGRREIFFGLMLMGAGSAWIDDVEFLVDGRPYAEAPELVLQLLPWESDTEFDDGSGINDMQLSAEQIENLATLIEVWGFVKYHHPRVASGDIHTDFELFRVLPGVLGAVDSDASILAITEWVQSLGLVDACEVCATLPEDIHLSAPIDWIEDRSRLGDALSDELIRIHVNRPVNSEHPFVDQALHIGNPVFDGEPAYTRLDRVDAGYRILALARLWNIVRYWAPYRDQVDTPWPDVLRATLPRLATPLDGSGYVREMLRLVAEIRDTHANLWSSLEQRPPVGSCFVNAGIRFVEGKAVVWEVPASNDTDLLVGDVIVEIDGQVVDDLVESWRPLYAASNEPTRLRDIGLSLTAGDCEESRLRVSRQVDGEENTVEVVSERIDRGSATVSQRFARDRHGETYQELSAEVAYIKLSSITLEEVEDLVRRIQDKAGLVVDIRNYPSAFVTFELGQRLVSTERPFARFTRVDTDNPGVFVWGKPLSLAPETPGYDGIVTILVDETTQSNAEYTSMAFRVGDSAVVVGSTTAGADGNVSAFALPGGLRTMISGIGVFYPDKTATQRVGIVPDIEVKPTIAGIRAGRDEVLEAAIRHVFGGRLSDFQLQEMARQPAVSESAEQR